MSGGVMSMEAQCEANAELVQTLIQLRRELPDGSKMVHVYGKAIRAIAQHTEPLRNAREAKKLKHVGPFIVGKLVSVFPARDDAAGAGAAGAGAGAGADDSVDSGAGAQPKLSRSATAPASSGGARSGRAYVPQFGRAPWLLLMAAWCNGARRGDPAGAFTRDEVEEHYLVVCDGVWGGLDKPQAAYADVWRRSLRPLVSRSLMASVGSSSFRLTAAGVTAAQSQAALERAAHIRVYASGQQAAQATLSPEFAMPAHMRGAGAGAAGTPDSRRQSGDSAGSGHRRGGLLGGAAAGATPAERRVAGRSMLATSAAASSGAVISLCSSSDSDSGGNDAAPVARSRAPGTASRTKRGRVGGSATAAGAHKRPRMGEAYGSPAPQPGRQPLHDVACAAVQQHGGVSRPLGPGWVARSGRSNVLQRWEVVLLLDNREKFNQRDKDFIGNRLTERGMPVEVRQLPLGDIMWVVRRKAVGGGRGPQREFVMNYLIERKQVADLEISIRNGRYGEQKHRMGLCGLTRLIYLVEGSSFGTSLGRGKSVPFAMISSQVFSGMYVHHSTSVQETIDYLCTMHANIEALFADDAEAAPVVRTRHDAPSASVEDLADLAGRAGLPEKLITFKRWGSGVTKSAQRTMSHVFGQQLCQIKGLGSQRAEAIVAAYPTAHSFVRAMRAFRDEAQAVAALRALPTKGQQLGPKLCKLLYNFYLCHDFTTFVPSGATAHRRR